MLEGDNSAVVAARQPEVVHIHPSRLGKGPRGEVLLCHELMARAGVGRENGVPTAEKAQGNVRINFFIFIKHPILSSPPEDWPRSAWTNWCT